MDFVKEHLEREETGLDLQLDMCVDPTFRKAATEARKAANIAVPQSKLVKKWKKKLKKV